MTETVRTTLPKEVARSVGLSVDSIGRYAREGLIPFETTPKGHRRYNVEEVQAALADMAGPSLAGLRASAPTHTLPTPVIAEVDDVRLLWHLRELRGSRSLRAAAALVGMNRDELGRIERGETKAIRFRTLAKLRVAYRCSLGDLLEVAMVPAPRPTPLQAGVVAALSAGTLGGDGPRRRSVRRSTDGDVVNEGDEALFAASNPADQSPPRRHRAPVGTLNR